MGPAVPDPPEKRDEKHNCRQEWASRARDWGQAQDLLRKNYTVQRKPGVHADDIGEQGWGKEWCWTGDLEGQMEREKRNPLISLLTLLCSETRRKRTQ